MSRRKNPGEDPARFLVNKFAPERSTAGLCPDPGQLAGYAESRLLPAERQRVEEHVARCEDCRVLVTQLAGEPAPASQRRRQRVLGRATGAALVAAVLLLAAFWPRSSAPVPVQPVETEAALLAAARELGIAPLSREERLRPGSRERGALVALHPAGVILGRRPHALWEPALGVDEYEVAFHEADGMLWRSKAKGVRCAYPTGQAALELGRTYFWEVGYTGGPFGDDSAQRSFVVASQRQRREFRDTWQAIEANTPSHLVDLLRAHFAIRKKFYAEAERAARAYVEANPNDRVGRETLFQILELLGSSEAGGMLED